MYTLSSIINASNASYSYNITNISIYSVSSVFNASNASSNLPSIITNVSNASYYNSLSYNTNISAIFNFSNSSFILSDISYNSASAYNNWQNASLQASTALNISNLLNIPILTTVAFSTIQLSNQAHTIYTTILGWNTNVSNNYLSTMSYMSNISLINTSINSIYTTHLSNFSIANTSVEHASFVSNYATTWYNVYNSYTNVCTYIKNSSVLYTNSSNDNVSSYYWLYNASINLSDNQTHFLNMSDAQISLNTNYDNITQYTSYSINYAYQASSTMIPKDASFNASNASFNASNASSYLPNISVNISNASYYKSQSYNTNISIQFNFSNISFVLSNISYNTTSAYNNWQNASLQAAITLNASNTLATYQMSTNAFSAINLSKQAYDIYTTIIGWNTNVSNNYLSTMSYASNVSLTNSNINSIYTTLLYNQSTANISVQIAYQATYYATTYSNALTGYSIASDNITNSSTLFTNSNTDLELSKSYLYNISINLSDIQYPYSNISKINISYSFSTIAMYSLSSIINASNASYSYNLTNISQESISSIFNASNASSYLPDIITNLPNASYYNRLSYNINTSAIFNFSNVSFLLSDISYNSTSAYNNWQNASKGAEIAINASNAISSIQMSTFAFSANNLSNQAYIIYTTILGWNTNVSNIYLSTLSYMSNVSLINTSINSIYTTHLSNFSIANTSVEHASFVSNYATTWYNVYNSYTNVCTYIKNSSVLYTNSSNDNVSSYYWLYNASINLSDNQTHFLNMSDAQISLNTNYDNITQYTSYSINYAYQASSTMIPKDASFNASNASFNASNASSYLPNISVNISNASYYKSQSYNTNISIQFNFSNISFVLSNISYNTTSAYNNWQNASLQAAITLNASNTLATYQMSTNAFSAINLSKQAYDIYTTIIGWNTNVSNNYLSTMSYASNISLTNSSIYSIYNNCLSNFSIANTSIDVSNFASIYATSYSIILPSYLNASNSLANSNSLYIVSNVDDFESNSHKLLDDCQYQYKIINENQYNLSKNIYINKIDSNVTNTIIFAKNTSSTMNTIHSLDYLTKTVAYYNVAYSDLNIVDIIAFNASNCNISSYQDNISIQFNLSNISSILYNLSSSIISALDNASNASNQALIALNVSNSLNVQIPQIIQMTQDAINSSNDAYNIYNTMIISNKNISISYLSTLSYASNVSLTNISINSIYTTIINYQSIANTSVNYASFVTRYATQYYTGLVAYSNAYSDVANSSIIENNSSLYNTSSKEYLYNTSVNLSYSYLQYSNISLSSSSVNTNFNNINTFTLSSIINAFNSSSTMNPTDSAEYSNNSTINLSNASNILINFSLNISKASYYNILSSNNYISSIFNLSNISTILFNISLSTYDAYNNWKDSVTQAEIAINASNTIASIQMSTFAFSATNLSNQAYTIYTTILEWNKNISNNYISSMSYVSEINITNTSVNVLYNTIISKQTTANSSILNASIATYYANTYSTVLTVYSNASTLVYNSSNLYTNSSSYTISSTYWFNNASINLSNASFEYKNVSESLSNVSIYLKNISMYYTSVIFNTSLAVNNMNILTTNNYTVSTLFNLSNISNIIPNMSINLFNASIYNFNCSNYTVSYMMNQSTIYNILLNVSDNSASAYNNYINASREALIAINASNSISSIQIVNLASIAINLSNQAYSIYNSILDLNKNVSSQYLTAITNTTASTLIYYNNIIPYLQVAQTTLSNASNQYNYCNEYIKTLNYYNDALHLNSSVIKWYNEANTYNISGQYLTQEIDKNVSNTIFEKNNILTCLSNISYLIQNNKSSIKIANTYASLAISTTNPIDCQIFAYNSSYNSLYTNTTKTNIILNQNNALLSLYNVSNNIKNFSINLSNLSDTVKNISMLSISTLYNFSIIKQSIENISQIYNLHLDYSRLNDINISLQNINTSINISYNIMNTNYKIMNISLKNI